MPPKLLTITQYAKKYGISRQGVLWRINHGNLEAQKVGSYWIITEPETKDQNN